MRKNTTKNGCLLNSVDNGAINYGIELKAYYNF